MSLKEKLIKLVRTDNNQISVYGYVFRKEKHSHFLRCDFAESPHFVLKYVYRLYYSKKTDKLVNITKSIS
jgi:hypothetical protein